MTQYLTTIRVLKYLLVSKTLVASAIGIQMDQKGEFSFLTFTPKHKFSVSAFSIQSYWKGAADAGAVLYKKRENTREKTREEKKKKQRKYLRRIRKMWYTFLRHFKKTVML